MTPGAISNTDLRMSGTCCAKTGLAQTPTGLSVQMSKRYSNIKVALVEIRSGLLVWRNSTTELHQQMDLPEARTAFSRGISSKDGDMIVSTSQGKLALPHPRDREPMPLLGEHEQ